MAMIELPVGDVQMAVYVSRPAGVPVAALVVVQEAFGLTDHIKSVVDRAAAAGHLAVAPALFHRQGSPIVAYDEMDSAKAHLGLLADAELMADFLATLDWLAAEGFPAERVAVVGFCMGGSVSYVYGARFPLLAAITFYGSGIEQGRFGMPSMLDLVPMLRTPWLGLFGDLDRGIPIDQVEELRAATAGAPVPTRIVRYPEAGHGFHCDARPAAYNREAAVDGWARTLAFIAEQLSAAPSGSS